MKNMKIAPFIGFFGPYMVGYDKQKLFYDNQHGKMKKVYISDFYFGNFVTEICAKHTERFSKSIK